MRITGVLGLVAIAMSQMGGCLGSNLNNEEVVAPYTIRASVASAGTEANAESIRPAISADGRYVAFESYATNLVSEPVVAASEWHIYRRDTSSGKTELVDIGMDGVAAAPYGSNRAAISADGRYVYFQSFATNLAAKPFTASGNRNLIYRRDMNDSNPATRIECVSVGTSNEEPNGNCGDLSVSGDGRFVAFTSDARNLASGPSVTGGSHVYRRDLTLSSSHTVMVSIKNDGSLPTNTGSVASVYSKAPKISRDGGFVVFASNAIDLVNSPAAETGSFELYRRNMALSTNGTEMVSVTPQGAAFKVWYGKHDYWDGGAISADGNVIAFSSIAADSLPGSYLAGGVFLRNISAGTTTLVSVNDSGIAGNGLTCVVNSVTPVLYFSPALSADGRLVVFWSDSSNLVRDDTNIAKDIFLRDTVAGTTERISVATGGAQVIAESTPYTGYRYAISADGAFVAFDSPSGDFVAGDLNGATDVFRRGPQK